MADSMLVKWYVFLSVCVPTENKLLNCSLCCFMLNIWCDLGVFIYESSIVSHSLLFLKIPGDIKEIFGDGKFGKACFNCLNVSFINSSLEHLCAIFFKILDCVFGFVIQQLIDNFDPLMFIYFVYG